MPFGARQVLLEGVLEDGVRQEQARERGMVS